MTPYKAIREKCLDCCCYSCDEVRMCIDKGCALWAHRMGKRPTTSTSADADAVFKEVKARRAAAYHAARTKARTED